MISIAALLLTAATAQTSDGIYKDSFDSGAACPASISGSTGTLTLRRISNILYLPSGVRNNVDVTEWDNIWGHIDALDGITSWPGVPGASPTIATIGKTEYVGAEFQVPANALLTLNGTFKHVMYGGGPNIDVAISQTCGDFQPAQQGCWVRDDPADDQPMLRWRMGSGSRYWCGLDPDTTYFMNIRFTDPHTTGPNCSGITCQSTIQQYIGGF
ncbi:MAG TPA: hypothetical protein VH375_05290 [Rhodanobacteraceae bacterium]